MTFIVSVALLYTTTSTVLLQITCTASELEKESERLTVRGLEEFTLPNPLNEVEIILQKQRKNIPKIITYYQEFTSQKNLTVRGFSLYLVHRFKKTKVLAVSEEKLTSEHKKIRPFKKRKKKQKLSRDKNKILSKRRTKKIKQLDDHTKLDSLVPKRHTPLYLYSSTNENITMVLSSDQFVFKPAIPINETNYPLDNMDKPELYASEKYVDKILSYSFTDPVIKDYIKFPSVSKIIEETISDKTRQVLANWRQKMIDDLGEEGFYQHSEALKTRGTEFHMAVRNAVLGKTTENCTEVTQNSLKSLAWVLEHITNPMAVESTIAHPKLGYRGVADCIAMFRNIPVIIDWKLSDKPKRDLKDTYDAPVQITAYIGALNHDPNYQWGVNHGLVAVAYANGDPCDVFLLAPKHCQIYWRHWLMRFDKFKARSHLHLDHNIDEKSLEQI